MENGDTTTNSPSAAAEKGNEVDQRASLHHVLASEPEQPAKPTAETPSSRARNSAPRSEPLQKAQGASSRRTTAMTTSTRRNANGSVSSVYSGNRIQYLKKEDGQPLWRKDIQYTLLKTVFENDVKVFTKTSDGTTGHSFAEIYVDAMAKSSKCSQILKDKLLSDGVAAVNMAMICLLVNVGRMNTTLNFFPEMRARVRTYHPIPVLQAKQSAQDYKQLQDGPRLKSILKGATEDVEQPNTIDGIMRTPKPRTNPVNLIFVLSQYAPKISEMHFFPPRDFFDIFMRTTLSSRSRATAFLWMMWWYLESDFTAEDALRNPFGPGQAGPDDDVSMKVPSFEHLSDEEAAQEDVDTPEEIRFGEDMQKERHAILANDMPPAAAAPRKSHKLHATAMIEQQYNYRFRASPFATSPSDSEGPSRPKLSPSVEVNNHADSPSGRGGYSNTSDPSFTAVPGTRIDTLLNEDGRSLPQDGSAGSRRASGRSTYARRTKDSALNPFERVQFVQPGPHERESALGRKFSAEDFRGRTTSGRRISSRGLPLPPAGRLPASSASAAGHTGSGHIGKRSRLPTAHQQAIAQSRRDRVNYLLHQNMRNAQVSKKNERRRRGIILDAWINARSLPDDWDSEDDEARRWGGIHDMRTEGRDGHDDAGERAAELSRGWRKIGITLDGIVIARIKRGGRRQEDKTTSGQDGGAAYGDGDGATREPGANDEVAVKKPRGYRRRPPLRAPASRVRKRVSRGSNTSRGGQGIPMDVYFGRGGKGGDRNEEKDKLEDEAADAAEGEQEVAEANAAGVYDDGEAAGDEEDVDYGDGDEVGAEGDLSVDEDMAAEEAGGSGVEGDSDMESAAGYDHQGEDIVMAEA